MNYGGRIRDTVRPPLINMVYVPEEVTNEIQEHHNDTNMQGTSL